MKGSNTLMLNPATMLAAIEYYLNECVFVSDAAVTVASVSANNCSSLATFKVVLATPVEQAKK